MDAFSIRQGNSRVQKNVTSIRKETSFFSLPASESKPARYRRGAVVGLDALAVEAFLCGGVALEGFDSCRNRRFTGGCHGEAEASAVKI